MMTTLGCSSTTRWNESYPVIAKKYNNELVSISTALDLARTSYLKACMDFYEKNQEEKGHFKQCLLKAQEHVKNNIIFMLEQ